MSIRIMTSVWEGYPGSGSELLTMLALADWSDDEGRCFPSMASIAKKIRLSHSQAQRIVHKLIDDGYVAVTANRFGGYPGETRRYKLNLDLLRGRDGATGSRDATGRADAQDGSRRSSRRGSASATQIVIEPPATVKGQDGPQILEEPRALAGFQRFWDVWPKSERKQDKRKCLEKWQREGLDSLTDTILADIATKVQTRKWTEAGGRYIEAPLVYLNGRRWEDGVEPEAPVSIGTLAGAI